MNEYFVAIHGEAAFDITFCTQNTRMGIHQDRLDQVCIHMRLNHDKPKSMSVYCLSTLLMSVYGVH